METRPKSAWILIAGTTRARVLQQEPGSPMVVLESFIHAAGGGHRGEPPVFSSENECSRFAQELAQFLEQEARLGRFGCLTLFACGSFLEELKGRLGKVTAGLLSGTHELDLTSVGLAELERRVTHELALAAH